MKVRYRIEGIDIEFQPLSDEQNKMITKGSERRKKEGCEGRERESPKMSSSNNTKMRGIGFPVYNLAKREVWVHISSFTTPALRSQ